ncbi:MAG: DNA alkylation repair protein [Chloroflexota bacterium]
MTLYKSIVDDLITLGSVSPYKADANEPDPRYKSYGVRAAGKKQVIRTHRAAIRALSRAEKLALAHKLVQSRVGEQQSVALHILEQLVDHFTPGKFAELDSIVRCLHGWSKIDSYTGSLLRDVLLRHPTAMIDLVHQWNQAEDMWLRRTSVVLFTRKIARAGRFNDVAFEMCNKLLEAPEPLVQKGVGWCLKDMMHSDKARVIAYVKQLRAAGVPSTITLYAIKDLKGKERNDVLGRAV